MIVMHLWLMLVFLLYKQKTAYEMRISDWSSDVCSSDLNNIDCCPKHVHASEGPSRVHYSLAHPAFNILISLRCCPTVPVQPQCFRRRPSRSLLFLLFLHSDTP